MSFNLFQASSIRQKLDDLGELEEAEGRETKQRATSVKIFMRISKEILYYFCDQNYIPSVLNACIEEFDLSPSTTKVRRSSTREGNYGTIDQVNQPMVVGTGDENDLLTD